jgi:hypothetical protein
MEQREARQVRRAEGAAPRWSRGCGEASRPAQMQRGRRRRRRRRAPRRLASAPAARRAAPRRAPRRQLDRPSTQHQHHACTSRAAASGRDDALLCQPQQVRRSLSGRSVSAGSGVRGVPKYTAAGRPRLPRQAAQGRRPPRHVLAPDARLKQKRQARGGARRGGSCGVMRARVC